MTASGAIALDGATGGITIGTGTADVTIQSTGGAIDLSGSAISGAGDGVNALTLNADTTINMAGTDNAGNELESLNLNAGGAVDIQGAVDLGAGNLDISFDIDDNSAEVFQIDQTITANNIYISGGGTGTGDTVDVDQTLMATNNLTIENAAEINLGANVDLIAEGGTVSAATNIAAINLSGAGSTNTIEAPSGNVDLGAITDSASVAELYVVGEDITLASVELNDAGNDRLLSIDLDGSVDNGVRTLTTGAIETGSLDVDGQGGDDIINFNSTVETTVDSIDVATAGTVNLSGDVTSNSSIAVSNADDVRLLGGIALEAQGGNVDIIEGIGSGISLDGTGTVAIRTTGANDDVRLAAVTSGNDESLDLNAGGTVDIQGAVNLGGGDLDVSFDTDDNGTEVFQVDQAITANNIDISGGGTGTGDAVDVGTLETELGRAVVAAGLAVEDVLAVRVASLARRGRSPAAQRRASKCSPPCPP